MEAVYVTRDTYSDCVEVWPATVGIRKFLYSYVTSYGAAWSEDGRTGYLYSDGRRTKRAEYLTKNECRKRFGFYPRASTAWYVNTRGKISKVDIDFSD